MDSDFCFFFQYLANVDDWSHQCYGDSDVACTVPALEASIHEHQQLMENITQSYGEVEYVLLR